MKKIIVLAASLFFAVVASAGEDPEETNSKQFPLSIGVHMGMDIGAAVPWPPGKVMGGENKMKATPHLTPALGLSFTGNIDRRWSLTLETTYKVVELDAKAWVEDQTFVDRNDDPWQWVSFRGTAFTEMSFPMLEFPLYASYTFKNGSDRVFLGGYYARVFNAKFSTMPYKGMLFNVVDGKPDYDHPKGSVSPDVPHTHNFNDAMSKWDAGFVAGYERNIFPRITLSGRFSMGFNDIFQSGKKYLTYSMLHMRGTVVVSYAIIK